MLCPEVTSSVYDTFRDKGAESKKLELKSQKLVNFDIGVGSQSRIACVAGVGVEMQSRIVS